MSELFASLIHDLRFSLRRLRNHLAFSVTAVIVLALGLGASTAVLSMLCHVELGPLPYAHSEWLVFVPNFEMKHSQSHPRTSIAEGRP